MVAEGSTAEGDSIVHASGRWEGTFESAFDHAHPTQSVAITAEFRGPSGEQRQARGFWDGGRSWRIRFSPDVPGTWTYRTTCSDALDAGLHGRTGSFDCAPYRGENPLYRHGTIKVAASGRHF